MELITPVREIPLQNTLTLELEKNQAHFTIWDPPDDKLCVVKGTITYETNIYPHKVPLSVSLELQTTDCPSPAQRKKYNRPSILLESQLLLPAVRLFRTSAPLFPKLHTDDDSDPPIWTLTLEHRRSGVQIITDVDHSCIFDFEVQIPVSTEPFKDMGSGDITGAFVLVVECRERGSGVRHWRVQTITISVLWSERIYRK